jgi:hypothetical protein
MIHETRRDILCAPKPYFDIAGQCFLTHIELTNFLPSKLCTTYSSAVSVSVLFLSFGPFGVFKLRIKKKEKEK